MIYQRLEPSPQLRDIVDSIWVQEKGINEGPLVPASVVPTGTVEILFHYGDPIAHVDQNGTTIMPRSYVTGQRVLPVTTLATGNLGIIIASIHPWGLHSLFPDCTSARDAYLNLDELVSKSAITRLEARLDSTTQDCRVKIVEEFLLSQRVDTSINKRVAAASRLIAANRGGEEIDTIASRLGMSRRHLSREFKSTVGISPKQFSRVMRFQQALRLWKSSDLSWAMIAAECRYSDQAHLIREFGKFAGKTPHRVESRETSIDRVFNQSGNNPYFSTVYLTS